MLGQDQAVVRQGKLRGFGGVEYGVRNDARYTLIWVFELSVILGYTYSNAPRFRLSVTGITAPPFSHGYAGNNRPRPILNLEMLPFNNTVRKEHFAKPFQPAPVIFQ